MHAIGKQKSQPLPFLANRKAYVKQCAQAIEEIFPLEKMK
jgi:hypothetical protein